MSDRIKSFNLQMVFRPIFIMATCVALLPALSASSRAQSGAKPARQIERVVTWAPVEQPVRVRVNDQTWSIPRNYLDVLEVKTGGVAEGMGLIAHVGTLTPRTIADLQHERQGVTGLWSYLLVEAVVPGDMGRRFEIKYRIFGRTAEPSVLVGEPYGLREYREARTLVPRDKPLGGDFPQVRFEPAAPLDERRFIVCSLPNDYSPAHYSPQCQHYFVVDDVIITANYARRHLANWAEFERRAADRIRSFRQSL